MKSVNSKRKSAASDKDLLTLKSFIKDQKTAEKRQTEEALRDSKAKYQAIFESTGTATLIVEEDSTISLANQECFSLTGYSPEELIGKKWTQYVETESLAKMIKNHNLRRQDPSLAPKKYEVKLINKSGETRYAILDIGMVQGSGQSIFQFLILLIGLWWKKLL